MSDMMVSITIFLLVGLLLLPAGLFLIEKALHLYQLEVVKDHLDLGLDWILVSLEPGALSDGRLRVSNWEVEARLGSYLQERGVVCDDVKVVLLPRGGTLEGEVRLKVKVMANLINKNLLNRETYEIIRKIKIPVDR
ncbi:MAG: hypothetical protein AVO33_03170 [delta proteobacterium ML8_F1]|nr:MAG: hypothetical protein AVO33_03170 [delta proteobacterium ML8_F1]